jgi:hypothetical protein
MCCILCYQNTVIGINPRTQARKGLISYYKTNGITFHKKHVDANHYSILLFLLSSLPLKWDFCSQVCGLLINMLVVLPHDFKVRGLPRCAIWSQLGGEHTFSC